MTGGASPPLPERIASVRITRALGRGAMGEVYEGVDEALGRAVAVKLLAADDTDVEARTRFDREAHALARLQHPNVVGVFSKGRVEQRPYFVMELVEGPSALDLIRDGPLPLGQALMVIRQAALGLEAAASAGVVHRDVKPANLLVAADGTVKVADFGVCKIPELGPHMTEAGTTLGTPFYMAPEQARGEAVDTRADQYALGATLFHLLSGRPPYASTQTVAQLLAHQKEPVPDIRAVAPGVPAGVALVMQRMMAKTPAERFASYAELLAALDDAELQTLPAPRRGPPGWPLAVALVVGTTAMGVALWQMFVPPARERARAAAAASPGSPAVANPTVAHPAVAAPSVPPPSTAAPNGSPPPSTQPAAAGTRATPPEAGAAASADASIGRAPTAPRNAAVPHLVQRIQLERGPARAGAMTSLARSGDPQARPTLEAVLGGRDDPDAPLAALLLGELGEQQATDALVNALLSSRRATVLAAVDALAALRDVRAVEPLKALAASHADATIRARAQRAGALLFAVEH